MKDRFINIDILKSILKMIKMKKPRDTLKYDSGEDILSLNRENKKYLHSISFEDFIIDIDEKKEICGVEILNASRYLKLDKFQLRELTKVHAKIEISYNRLICEFKLEYKYRNKISEKDLIYNDINTLVNQNLLGEITAC